MRNQRKISTTIYIDPKEKSDLRRIAIKNGLTEAAIIRVAIREAIEWHKNLLPKFREEMSITYEVFNKERALQKQKKKVKYLLDKIKAMQGDL